MDQLNKNLDKYEKALKTASEESKPSYQKLIDKTMPAIIKLTNQIGSTVAVKAEEPKHLNLVILIKSPFKMTSQNYRNFLVKTFKKLRSLLANLTNFSTFWCKKLI